MDEKDPKDEELNPQGQDDVNDADDSFGLPDLDYKPLEEDSSETEEESSSEENTPLEEEAETEEAESTYTSESPSDDQNEVEDGIEQEETEEEKPALRYQLEEESSNAPKIIGGIIAVLVIAALVWYFAFYQKQQKEIAAAEKAKQEQLDEQKAAEEEATRKKKAAAAAADAADAKAEAQVEVQENAGVQILSERSGRYYIVLESFVDEDFAKDFGNKIAQKGTPSFLIPPYSKKKMQRVAIGGYDSMDEAQSALTDLSEEFGTGKWILKY